MPCPRREHWNTEKKICQDICPAPWYSRESHGILVCEKTCPKVTVFIPNRGTSCFNECPYPWIPQTVNELETCQAPCKKGQYWNPHSEKCQNFCGFPMKVVDINSTQGCQSPCEKNEYYLQGLQDRYGYNVKYCSSSCEKPWIIEDIDGFLVCQQPCLEVETYDPETDSCVRRCPPLRTERTMNTFIGAARD